MKTDDGSETTRTALLPKRGEVMMQKLRKAGNSLLAAAGNVVAVTAYELSEILPTQTEEEDDG